MLASGTQGRPGGGLHRGGDHLFASSRIAGAADYLIEDVTGIEVTTLTGDEGLVLELTPLKLTPLAV